LAVLLNTKKQHLKTWRKDVLGESGSRHWDDDVAKNSRFFTLGSASLGQSHQTELGRAIKKTVIIEMFYKTYLSSKL
jgi:hypothetical protein